MLKIPKIISLNNDSLFVFNATVESYFSVMTLDRARDIIKPHTKMVILSNLF